MKEFEQNRSIYENGWRGTYLIIPVKVCKHKNFSACDWIRVPFDDTGELSDKSDLLKRRCESGYVNKYVSNDKSQEIMFAKSEKIRFSNQQIFLFENEIGFLTLFVFCHNKDINSIYKLVNNGYIGTYEENDTYEILYDEITRVIAPLNLEIFTKDKSLLLNEAYVHNVAFVEERFRDLETLERITLNVHKQIGLETIFEDKSEKDIWYTFGARDIIKRTYRWGCCISTLDISFVYQDDILKKTTSPEEISKKMLLVSAGDLLLTVLVLIQKYTCMQLNADIHNELYENTNTKKRGERRRTIKQLKKTALDFRAFGTLAPSQVSRWNNVCETYRGLLEVQGIDEALGEIEQKIDSLSAEQEQQAAEKQNLITTIITVFGLVSIIASIMSITDLVLSGGSIMVITGIISTLLVFILAIVWIKIYAKK